MIGLYLSNFLYLSEAHRHLSMYFRENSPDFSVDRFTQIIYYSLDLFFLLQNLLIVLLILDLLFRLVGINFTLTRLVTHFFTTNLAIFIGFFKFLGGVKSSIWNPTKR